MSGGQDRNERKKRKEKKGKEDCEMKRKEGGKRADGLVWNIARMKINLV